MVRGVQQLGCLLLCGVGAWPQADVPKVVVDLDGFRYPPIASGARIRGDVVFAISDSAPVLVATASPLLTAAVRDNLATWTLPRLPRGRYLVSYHFELIGDGLVKKTVPIGSRFGRFLRRLVGAPTQAIVNACPPARDPAADPPPRFTLVEDGDLKIDVFIETVPRCVETNTSQIALLTSVIRSPHRVY
ncbi:MAG TPA: hypothetical protein VGG72_14185 [Bryobacteraceae bacterium]|jgi:hypothetical protein